MKVAVIVALALFLVAAAGLAYVRLAPSDPADWHVDVLGAEPGQGRSLRLPGASADAAPVLDLPPAEALARFDSIVMETPRTMRLAGSAEEGRITYITRSRWVGFPDYTTVQAVAVEGGTALAIFARLRFGQSDLGVNSARVDGWLAALDAGS